jgi:hypothetical protein
MGDEAAELSRPVVGPHQGLPHEDGVVPGVSQPPSVLVVADSGFSHGDDVVRNTGSHRAGSLVIDAEGLEIALVHPDHHGLGPQRPVQLGLVMHLDEGGQRAHLPPISTLFAAFLGYNPVQHLVGAQTIAHLSASQQAALAQRSFFPGLISGPFQQGLHAAFDFAIVMSLLAAAASWTRGKRYVYTPAVGEPADDRVLTRAGGPGA